MKTYYHFSLLALLCLTACTADDTTPEKKDMQLTRVESSDGDTTIYTYNEAGQLSQLVTIGDHDFRAVSTSTPVYTNGKLTRLNHVHVSDGKTYNTHEEFEYEGNNLMIRKSFGPDNQDVYRMFQYDSLAYTDGRFTGLYDRFFSYKMTDGVIDPSMELVSRIIWHMDIKWKAGNVDSMFMYGVNPDGTEFLANTDAYTYSDQPNYNKKLDQGVFTLMLFTTMGSAGANNVLTYRNHSANGALAVDETYHYDGDGILRTITRNVNGGTVTLKLTYEEIQKD